MKNKVIRALLSLALAIGLWLYVVTVVSPGTEVSFNNISVKFQNESLLYEEGLMVLGESPQVNLTLSGDRVDLNKLRSADLTVTANLAGISTTGIHQLRYSVGYPGSDSHNAVTVKSQSPDYITVKVVERAVKTVAVDVEYIGSVPESYIADKENILLSVQQLEIAGPKEQVDAVAKASVRVNLDGKTESITQNCSYTLWDENGLAVSEENMTVSAETIDISLSIRKTKEVKLAIKPLPSGGIKTENFRIRITPSTILVSGSEEKLAQMEELVLAEVNLAEISGEEPVVYPIVMPEGVTNESGMAEASAEYSFPGTKTATFKVKNISAVNVPQGMGTQIFTKELEVTLRGPSNALKAVSADDITVSVDFTGAQVGTDTKKPLITVNEKYAGVVAVGTYSVSAKVFTK